METQTYSPEEFSKKLTEILAEVGKLSPAAIINLDMEGSMSDPIGWIMRNTMRIEMARLVFIESVYRKFATTGQKRQTADLLIASSRAMAASLLKDVILKAAGGGDVTIDRLGFILGVDPSVFSAKPHWENDETVQDDSIGRPAEDNTLSP